MVVLSSMTLCFIGAINSRKVTKVARFASKCGIVTFFTPKKVSSRSSSNRSRSKSSTNSCTVLLAVFLYSKNDCLIRAVLDFSKRTKPAFCVESYFWSAHMQILNINWPPDDYAESKGFFSFTGNSFARFRSSVCATWCIWRRSYPNVVKTISRDVRCVLLKASENEWQSLSCNI